MERYIDGFVLPILKENLSEYQKVSEASSRVWKEHGALEYWECLGDDLHIEGTRSFVEMADAQDGETIIFAFAVFESRQARDEANKKIMADPRMAEVMNTAQPLFDCKRMAYGGFQQFVHA